MRAPRLLALAAGTALLAGCGLEQPTPIASVVSGGSYEWAEASYYCFEGEDPQAEPGSEQGCTVIEDRELPVVEATPGARIGVDVSKELAEGTWQVVIAPEGSEDPQEQRQTPLLEEHYFSFIADFGPENQPLRLSVRQVEGEGEPPTGVWDFLVVPRT